MGTFDYLDSLDEAVQESYDSVQEESVVQANQHGNGFPDEEVYSPAESEASGSYEPQKLNARHREIIRLHTLGYKGTEIAQVVGCTPQLVYMTVNSPLGQSFLSEIEDARDSSVQDVRERLQEMSPLAAEVMLDVLNNGKRESNKLKAAIKTLEMTGQKPGDTVNHNHMHLTKDDIEDIKNEHSGGPPVHSENDKDFNETNREKPPAEEAQIIETETNQAEDAKHISANSPNSTRQD